MIDILEDNFPKLNWKDVSKPSPNNRSQAIVMLAELRLMFKKTLEEEYEKKTPNN